MCPVSKWHCMVVVLGRKFCLADTFVGFNVSFIDNFVFQFLKIFNIDGLMENFAFIPTVVCFTIYFAVKICYLFAMTTDHVFILSM